MADKVEREAIAWARKFHETYERLAPSFGYATRPDTQQFDPFSPNGKLMVAVCEALLPTRSSLEEETERKIVESALYEASFLVDRIDELDWSQSIDDLANQHSGHVDPPLARLKRDLDQLTVLRAAAPQTQKEQPSGK